MSSRCFRQRRDEGSRILPGAVKHLALLAVFLHVGVFQVLGCESGCPHCFVILSERSDSKDPENIQFLIAVENFLSMLLVRKPESASPRLASPESFPPQKSNTGISGDPGFDLALLRYAPSHGAQDDRV